MKRLCISRIAILLLPLLALTGTAYTVHAVNQSAIAAEGAPVEPYIRLGDIFVSQEQIVNVRFWNESDGLHGEIATVDGDTFRTGNDDQARKLIDYLAGNAFDTNMH